MSRSFRVSTLACLFLSLSIACQSTSDTRAADEAALRKLDDEWSKAAGSRDVDKTISYYSDDAVVMPPNIPTLTGKEPIRSLWNSMLGSPSFSGGWKVSKVDVARSGDLAYVSGRYNRAITYAGISLPAGGVVCSYIVRSQRSLFRGLRLLSGLRCVCCLLACR